MRTLGFGTKVLAVCFFAGALVLTLGLPWYGPAPAPAAKERTIGEIHGPLQGFFAEATRWVAEWEDGVTAWQALESADVVIVAFAATAALAAVLANLASAEHTARAVLRGAVLVALATTLLKVFDTPGPNATTEPRFGVFAAATAALLLAVSGFGLTEQRLRATKRRAPASYTAPPPPAQWQDSGASVPPPGL